MSIINFALDVVSRVVSYAVRNVVVVVVIAVCVGLSAREMSNLENFVSAPSSGSPNPSELAEFGIGGGAVRFRAHRWFDRLQQREATVV